MKTEITRPRMGRPTEYNESVQEKADYYVYNWAELGENLPSRVGLCCYIGIAKSTSYEWEKSYPDFSDSLKAIDALQEQVLLNNGVSGKFNPTITKLVLNNHGYHEKKEVDHKSTDGTMSPQQHGDAVLDAIKAKHDAK